MPCSPVRATLTVAGRRALILLAAPNRRRHPSVSICCTGWVAANLERLGGPAARSGARLERHSATRRVHLQPALFQLSYSAMQQLIQTPAYPGPFRGAAGAADGLPTSSSSFPFHALTRSGPMPPAATRCRRSPTAFDFLRSASTVPQARAARGGTRPIAAISTSRRCASARGWGQRRMLSGGGRRWCRLPRQPWSRTRSSTESRLGAPIEFHIRAGSEGDLHRVE